MPKKEPKNLADLNDFLDEEKPKEKESKAKPKTEAEQIQKNQPAEGKKFKALNTSERETKITCKSSRCLKKHQSILVQSSVTDLRRKVRATIKFLASQMKLPGLIFSFDRPYKKVLTSMETDRVNAENILIVDCLSGENIKAEEENVIIESVPTDLTKYLIILEKFAMQVDKGFVLVDDLETLGIYEDEKRISKFLGQLIEKANSKNLKVVVFSVQDINSGLNQKIGPFFEWIEMKKFSQTRQ